MKIHLSLEEYVRRQQEEMLSPFNRWITGEKVGHNPDYNELAEYYVRSGGARDFSDRFQITEGPCIRYGLSGAVSGGVA